MFVVNSLIVSQFLAIQPTTNWALSRTYRTQKRDNKSWSIKTYDHNMINISEDAIVSSFALTEGA